MSLDCEDRRVGLVLNWLVPLDLVQSCCGIVLKWHMPQDQVVMFLLAAIVRKLGSGH